MAVTVTQAGKIMMTATSPKSHEFETGIQHGRDAMDLLARFSIVPTPERYKVAFLYQLRSIPELWQAVDRLVMEGTLSPALLDEIHTRFFCADLTEAQLSSANRNFENTVNQVVGFIDIATNQAVHYGSVLEDLTDKAGFKLKADLDAVVTNVLAETHTMAEVTRELEARLQASAREIEALRQHLEQIEHEASLDPLTGVGNRKRFDTALREAVAEAERDKHPLSLIMVDVDYFKKFNDTYGHHVGDQVLRLVARCMSDSIKGQDIIARYGGEEFVVILPRTRLEDGMKVAEAIRGNVAGKRLINRNTGSELGQITLSLGVATFRAQDTAETLLQRADAALYMVKSNSRNSVGSETDLPS
jgi:diguanylate cyclase